MLYHLDGTDVGYVLICIQIKSSAFEGFYWNIVEETSSSQRLLSGIDIRDTQSKEVSTHADFLGWLKTY